MNDKNESDPIENKTEISHENTSPNETTVHIDVEPGATGIPKLDPKYYADLIEGFRSTTLLNFNSETLDNLANLIGSTGSYLGGTVSAANDSLYLLEQKILKLERENTAYQSNKKDIEAAKMEIDNLKASIAGLEELKKANKQLEDFLRNNTEFIATAIETKARFNVVDHELASLQKRLISLEDRSNKTKDRALSTWAIVISVLSVVSAVALALWGPK
jgi:HPt (histidine-containing phosphotransfer) domain-containing protein